MSIDLLEQRLENLSVEAPEAGRVTARVLSRVGARRSRRWPRIAAFGIASVVLLLLVAYFIPAADTAVASVPVAGDVLREAGLVGAADRITSVNAVSTSSGYRVELVAAYADSGRTVLLMNSSPGISPEFNYMKLTDQFGRSYEFQNGSSDSRNGDMVLQFEPLAWPDQLVGARITLHMSRVGSGDPEAPVPVDGSWTLVAVLGVDEGVALPLPDPATLGAAHFRFTSVRYTPASVVIDVEITGVTMTDLVRMIPDGGKGTPAFTYDLIDPDGEVISGGSSISEDLGAEHLHFVGFRLNHGGNYTLRFTYVGSGGFERVLHIR
jgi:hypothetical protein